jgi:hypothetical protein
VHFGRHGKVFAIQVFCLAGSKAGAGKIDGNVLGNEPAGLLLQTEIQHNVKKLCAYLPNNRRRPWQETAGRESREI